MAIATRLLLLVALAVLPALGVLGYNAFDGHRTRSQEVRQQIVRTASEATVWVRNTVDDAQRLAGVIAQLPQVKGAAAGPSFSKACSDLLVSLRQDQPGKVDLGIANGDGVVVCNTRGTATPRRVEGRHFRDAMKANTFRIGTFAEVPSIGARYLSFASPVRDELGQPIGAVLVGLDLAWLSGHIRALFQLPDAVLSVHDRNHVFLARVPQEAGLIGKAPPPAVQALARFANTGVIEAKGADGLDRIGVINGLGFGSNGSAEPDLYIAVGLSREAALRDLNALTMRGMALLVLSAVLAVLAGWWGGHRFVKGPVESLLAASRRWRGGDYQARVDLRDRSSEFGRLASSFEDMANDLSRREAERNLAERELRDSEERLRLAQEAGGVGLWDWDLTTDRVRRIGTIYASWNLPSEAEPSERFYDIVHAEDREHLREQTQAAASGAGHFTAEYRIIDRNGATRWIAGQGEVICDPAGKPVRMIGINRDVTVRREAVDALARINADLERQVEERSKEAKEAMERLFEAQKMESVGQLTGGVAHDFNNLLMATLGSLGLLRKRLPDDPKAHRLLENAIQAAERGALLTQRLLAFARRQELKPEAVDIPALVSGMHDLLRRSLGPTIKITTEFPPLIPAALVDAGQLELAILNLCINARDAMPDGGPITISAHAAATKSLPAGLSPGDYMCILVADDGVGMDEATIARATEPFFTTKGIGKGTGLGLSMVAGLAAQSGGTLRILSRVSKGTTVELWLRQAGAASARSVPGVALTGTPSTGRRLTVLLVDDDALVAMGTASMLEDMGHAVLQVSSASEALDALRAGANVDLVITDHAMPGMTGHDLVRQLRESWPHLPAILATGYAELPEGVQADVLRLSKPFREDQLAAAIAEALNAGTKASNIVQLRSR